VQRSLCASELRRPLSRATNGSVLAGCASTKACLWATVLWRAWMRLRIHWRHGLVGQPWICCGSREGLAAAVVASGVLAQGDALGVPFAAVLIDTRFGWFVALCTLRAVGKATMLLIADPRVAVHGRRQSAQLCRGAVRRSRLPFGLFGHEASLWSQRASHVANVALHAGEDGADGSLKPPPHQVFSGKESRKPP